MAMAGQERVAGTDEFALVVGHAGADRSAGRRILHQCRSLLCGSERTRGYWGGTCRRAVSARRRRRPDLQRIRDRGVLPAAVRRYSRHCRRSHQRRSQARAAARDGACRDGRREGAGIGGGLAPCGRSHRPRRHPVGSYGGSLYAPEIGSLALGHLLNAGIVIALAAAAASLAEHPSTAAILVLAFTVGTWVLSFVAAFQGGA